MQGEDQLIPQGFKEVSTRLSMILKNFERVENPFRV